MLALNYLEKRKVDFYVKIPFFKKTYDFAFNFFRWEMSIFGLAVSKIVFFLAYALLTFMNPSQIFSIIQLNISQYEFNNL